MTLVSVVIPCFNYGAYLGEAVASVLAQEGIELEVMIVDDGSTDDSLAVARRLEAAHPEVTVLAQANAGQPAIARNNGIARARGPYIVCLDADDMMAPGMLARCAAVLDADPSVGMAYPEIEFFGAQSGRAGQRDWDARLLPRVNFLPTATMYRREAWEAAGGYATNVRGYEDWDLWVGCAEHGFPGRPARGAIFRYRIHGASLYGEAKERDQRLKAQVVLNHASLYGEGVRRWARGVLAGDPGALAVPHQLSWVPELPDRPRTLRIVAFADGAQASHFRAEGLEVRTPGDAPADGHDWELHAPAGELLHSALPDRTLRELIELADLLGFASVPVAGGPPVVKPGADGPSFPAGLVTSPEARGPALAEAFEAVLVGQAVRGFAPSGNLDARATGRLVGVGAFDVPVLAGAAEHVVGVVAAGGTPETVTPELVPMTKVLRAEAVLRGDAAGARRAAAAERALRRAGLDGARSFAVLAFADELVRDASLLRAFGTAFGAQDDVTLVIVCPQDAMPLARAVAAAGLERDDAGDLLAVPVLPRTADAVYSRRPVPPELTGVPRFDDTELAELRRLAERGDVRPTAPGIVTLG